MIAKLIHLRNCKFLSLNFNKKIGYVGRNCIVKIELKVVKNSKCCHRNELVEIYSLFSFILHCSLK